MSDVLKRSRPFSVTLLSILVLLWALLYVVRLREALENWVSLRYLLPVSPAYLALTGLGWGLVGLFLAASLWFGLSWSPRLARWVFLAYSVYYWLEYILLVDHSARSANWLFLAMLNLIVFAWMFWVLSRSKAKCFFGEIHER